MFFVVSFLKTFLHRVQIHNFYFKNRKQKVLIFFRTRKKENISYVVLLLLSIAGHFVILQIYLY